MSERILVECDCAPEYSHHCYKCGGTGQRWVPVPRPGEAIIKLDQNPLFQIKLGKVFAHLDQEEIQAIATAVCDEMERRDPHRYAYRKGIPS